MSKKLRTRLTFAEQAIKRRIGRRKIERGAPPLWYGYLAPATGLAALIVGILSASFSWNAYKVSKSNRDDTITPKLTITDITLTHGVGKIEDIPIVSYHIRNFGILTVYDVHAWLSYQYVPGPFDMTKPVPKVGSSDDASLEIGSTIVPSDYLDRTTVIFLDVSSPVTPNSSPDKSKGYASYKRLREGSALLQIEIRTQATDAANRGIILCDAFSYQRFTDKFERRGACAGHDILGAFRSKSR